MALPRQLQETFTPAEISFIAEQEKVFIVPRQKFDAIPLLSGTIPPMRPPQRAEVPIWLAILLKRQRRATIVPPEWLSIEALNEFLEDERKVTSTGELAGFSKMPFHWLAISDLLLDAASDDFPDAAEIRQRLRDLREIRQHKAREGLQVLEDKVLHMDNIALGEINELRILYSRTMDTLRHLESTRAEEEGSVQEDIMHDSE